MTRAAFLLVVSLAVATGCDLSVESGQTTVLSNGGRVFASATPNAVNVRPGGTLVVEDANLFGRGRLVETLPAGFPPPGAAIVAQGGTVRIVKGQVVGGNVLVTADPNAGVPLEPAVFLPSALEAFGSSVVIEGGTLIGSSVFGRPNPFFAAAATVNVSGGRLRISGGEFLAGAMIPPPALPPHTQSLSAAVADVEIDGGNFDGAPVGLASSRATIRGGSFGAGLVVNSVVAIDIDSSLRSQFCTEVRGGSFSSIVVDGQETLFIFGTGFNVPLGRVTTGSAGPLALTGVFANGAPIALDLTVFPRAQAFLAAPDAPGCGPRLVAIEN